MKIQILSLTAAAVLMAACQGEKKEEKHADSTSAGAAPVVKETQCYSSIQKRDTATLSLHITGTAATGELSYNIYEKDLNQGTFNGVVKGDTILADYTFNAEGTQSVRQVAFLKKGNQLIEGTAEVTEKDGKTVFKDPKSLKFDRQLVFEPADCK